MHSIAGTAELTIATVMVDIAVILLVGAVFGRWVRRLRQPAVIGEILAGLALGPSLLGLLPGNLDTLLFPPEVRPYLSVVAQIGLLLFMFVIGWELDPGRLVRDRGLAVAVSLGSIALSFGLGVLLAMALYPRHAIVGGERVAFVTFALLLGAAMSITAFPVLARILAERRLTQTRVGTVALSSAAIDDVLAWCLLAGVTTLATARGTADLIRTALLVAAYLVVMVVMVRPVLARLVQRWTRGRPSPYLFVVVVAAIFASSYATTWIGLHAIFGAFCVGAIMPRKPMEPLRRVLREPIDQISLVLMPVFFIVTGLGVDIAALTPRNYLELVAIIVLACAGKLLGSIGPALAFGMSWRDAGTVGLLVNTRGLTELIVLNLGVQLAILDGQMFTMMVIMALVTTAMAGPLLPSGPAFDASTVERPPVRDRRLTVD